MGEDFKVSLSLERRRIRFLEEILINIRDRAYSPRNDDAIWIDDQTPLGQFIDAALSPAPVTGVT